MIGKGSHNHNDWLTGFYSYKIYVIFDNRGKDVHYQRECYLPLAPKLSFWKICYVNIEKVSEEENNKYYV